MGDDELTFTVVNDMGGVDLDGSLTIPSSGHGHLVTATEVTEAEGDDEDMLQQHVRGRYVSQKFVVNRGELSKL
jgi:predicted ATP-grasp superfamily ATP-dependent carboligase